jgi:RND family efflux transporter MFP subunit
MADDDDERGGISAWVFLVLGVLVLAAGGGAYWFLTQGEDAAAAEPPPPPLVTAAEVESADRVAIMQTGFVQPLSEVTVTSEMAGRIESVADSFRRGRFVMAGETLVTLETDQLQANVSRAEAAVSQAEAGLAAAELERSRRDELEDEQFASEAQLQQSIVDVAAQRAQLASAQAELVDARNRLDDAEITAPFDALVTEVTADPGDLASAGVELGRLVASQAVEVELGLTPRDLALLGEPERAIGGRVLIRGTGQAAVGTNGEAPPVIAVGVVDTIGPQIAEATRTVPLLVRVPRPFDPDREGRPLRIGELVELELPIDVTQRAALTLPVQALRGGNVVWEVADGALVRHEVAVMARQDETVTVSSDALAPGALVLVNNLPSAAEGTEVRLERDRSESAASLGNGG